MDGPETNAPAKPNHSPRVAAQAKDRAIRQDARQQPQRTLLPPQQIVGKVQAAERVEHDTGQTQEWDELGPAEQ